MAFGELSATPQSKGLIGLFRGQTECKKNRFGNPPKPAKTVAVLGAGLMGAGIVQVSIDKGYKVIMKDTNAAGLARGISQIQKGFETGIKRKRLTAIQRDQHLSNLETRSITNHLKMPIWSLKPSSKILTSNIK